MGDHEAPLELQSVIGFKGTVNGGLLLHPDNEHMILPLGCTIVVRNLVQRTQSFLQGHDNTVNTLTLSKSGRLLASGQTTFMGFNADIIVWDFDARKEKYRLSLHKVCVQSLHFSHDDSYMASLGGQDDNSLVVWDMQSGNAVCGTPAANDAAKTVKFYNNDNMKLVTAGVNHVCKWELDLANKKLRKTACQLGKLQRLTTNVSIDETDSTVYCGTNSGDLMEITLERGLYARSAKNKQPYARGVTCSTMLPNGDLVIGTGCGELVRLNTKTLLIKAKSKANLAGGVTSMTLTSDGKNMFVGTDESNIYWVSTDDFSAELRNTCHFERINSVVFPRDYAGVFATCSLSDIRVWNSKTKMELLRIQVPNMECYAMCFMPDGKLILTAWSDGKVRAFLPQSGRLLYVINDAHRNGATAINATSNCSRLVTGGMEGEVRVWRLGAQTQTMEGSLKEHRGRVWSIQITKDDLKAFTSSSDGSCILWDLDAKTRSLCLFESTIFKALAYHPDESQILSTGSDRKITYWDTFDGQAIRILEGSIEGELTSLAMSKSGSHYMSGSGDKMVKLWEYDMGIASHVGVGHSGAVTCVAIAPDQKTAVSVGTEGAILVWDLPHSAQDSMNDLSALEG